MLLWGSSRTFLHIDQGICSTVEYKGQILVGYQVFGNLACKFVVKSIRVFFPSMWNSNPPVFSECIPANAFAGDHSPSLPGCCSLFRLFKLA